MPMLALSRALMRGRCFFRLALYADRLAGRHQLLHHVVPCAEATCERLGVGVALQQRARLPPHVGEGHTPQQPARREAVIVYQRAVAVELQQPVGYDAAAAVDHPPARGVVGRRVGYVEGGTVGIGLFDELVQVVAVVFVGAAVVGPLYAAPRRGVVARRREQHRRAVAKREFGLHQSLAERAPAYDGGAVVVLQRAADHFARRGRVLVDNHRQAALREEAAAVRIDVATPRVDPLGVHYQGLARKQLAGDAYSRRQRSTAVAAQVEDQVAHAAPFERQDGLAELVVARRGERVEHHIARRVVEHRVVGQRVVGHHAAPYVEGQQPLVPGPLHRHPHRRPARPAQTGHHAVRCHADTAHAVPVHGNNLVARQYAEAHRRAVVDDATHVGRVAFAVQHQPHALERTAHHLVGTLRLTAGKVGAVGVKLAQHHGNQPFADRVRIHGVDVLVLDQLHHLAHLALKALRRTRHASRLAEHQPYQHSQHHGHQ